MPPRDFSTEIFAKWEKLGLEDTKIKKNEKCRREGGKLEKGRRTMKKERKKKHLNKWKTFFFKDYFACHFQETTEILFGLPKWNFHWEKAKSCWE